MTILAVGQGMSNLIEEYDDAGSLIQLILIDCGGDSFEEEHVQDSAWIILDAMRRRAEVQEGGYDRYLDLLILSHQDEDHHNIINCMLGELQQRGQSFRVEMYWHFDENCCKPSGDYEGFKKRILDVAEDDGALCDGSAYENGELAYYIYESDNMQLIRIYANARGGNPNNSVSVAVALEVRIGETLRFLFPGDATSATMNCIYHVQFPEGYEMSVMSAPHHGSISSCSPRALGNFLDKLPTYEMIVSAGYNNEYGHPHRQFTEIAEGRICKRRPTSHLYRRNTGNKKGMPYENKLTDVALYTIYWPEREEDGRERGYCHYIYKITESETGDDYKKATGHPADIFALSAAECTPRSNVIGWRAVAMPGMAERR